MELIKTNGTYNISNPHIIVGTNKEGRAYQFDAAWARARVGNEITGHSRSVRPVRQEFSFTCQENINNTKDIYMSILDYEVIGCICLSGSVLTSSRAK